MFRGHVIFGIPHIQIIVNNFADVTGSCFIAKHQQLCKVLLLSILACKVSQKFPMWGQLSGCNLWTMVTLFFMYTHLHRTCHTAVFNILNSQLPLCTFFLGLRLEVASTCCIASSLRDGYSFYAYKCIWFSELLNRLCFTAEGGGCLWNCFLKSRWTPLHEFGLCNQSHKSSSRGETLLLKFAEPGIKIGNGYILPLFKSMIIWLSAGTSYMWVSLIVSSYFIRNVYHLQTCCTH